jgi:hypothetical protein
MYGEHLDEEWGFPSDHQYSFTSEVPIPKPVTSVPMEYAVPVTDVRHSGEVAEPSPFEKQLVSIMNSALGADFSDLDEATDFFEEYGEAEDTFKVIQALDEADFGDLSIYVGDLEDDTDSDTDSDDEDSFNMTSSTNQIADLPTMSWTS